MNSELEVGAITYAGNDEDDIRRRVHKALNGAEAHQLTWFQRLSAVVIVLSIVLAILATEPAISSSLGPIGPAFELAFITFFATEYGLRLWAAGADPRYSGVLGRIRYALTPIALLDLASILPYFAGWGTQSFLVRLLRLFRLLALSRLVRYSAAMQLVLRSVFERRHELLFSVSLAGSVILLSAAALYSVEADVQPEAFGSIPRALWWSVSTLTTVGYGDVVPVTVLGRLFAGITALSGIGLIAMPTGILSAAFSEAFRAKRDFKQRGAPGSPSRDEGLRRLE
ncbi:ion transporter [Lysobacter niastensis]|uniref:Ion transporter n=2 Tax=Lysobacter niastensis TaxID=380629 RepID=A0ABS0BAM7_9GAMM|nr:ion transporter [Lysobacter niastensis]